MPLIDTINAPRILFRVALCDEKSLEALEFLLMSSRKTRPFVSSLERLRPKVGLLHVTCSFRVNVC